MADDQDDQLELAADDPMEAEESLDEDDEPRWGGEESLGLLPPD